jgi:2-polyprenyl-6-methoxyphenol hydroxylase-like FAD-dependent oxidoreductase
MAASRWIALVALLAALPAACQTATPPEERPALVISPTPESRAELAGLVSTALGAEVALAADAFTADSLLIVERVPHRDPRGVRIQGREAGTPHHFRLLLVGDACTLLHVGTGRRWPLTSTTCAPAAGV